MLIKLHSSVADPGFDLPVGRYFVNGGGANKRGHLALFGIKKAYARGR